MTTTTEVTQVDKAFVAQIYALINASKDDEAFVPAARLPKDPDHD